MDENARLFSAQQQLEKDAQENAMFSMFSSLSVSEAIRACAMNGMSNKADRMKSDFKVPVKRFWHIKLRALIALRDFEALELVYDLITKAAQQLKRSSELEYRLQEDRDIILVLDVKGYSPQTCLYYLVSHNDQRIFWLKEHNEVKLHCASKQCRRNPSESHCILDQYWKHCELFPTTLTLTDDTINCVKEVLIQASGERITLKYSTSPYTKDDLSYMLNLIKEIEAGSRIRRSDHSTWVIAKLMSLHVNGALRNSYGQSDDYFDIHYSETTAREPYQRSWLLILLDLILFRCADAYAVQLYGFYDNFSPERWSRFVTKVDRSIRDSNLLATVLLSTSVSVLQIGSVDAATGPGKRSAVQIIIYTSIICSVGSIIVGLLIMQQYRAKGADTPLRAVTLLKRILKKPYGLERLAIACCLPTVLLVWSLVTFLTALSIIFYYQTNIAVQIPVTVTLGLVVLSLFGCLYISDMWLFPSEARTGGHKEGTDTPHPKVTFLVGRLRATSYRDF
ncbi:hypothetical protein EDC04DRAFT_2889520 [Pisolithus marmoratus]|nr:hypothetical protein EDC04DRAFT_2889520 [Pisolithus marmoratus]